MITLILKSIIINIMFTLNLHQVIISKYNSGRNRWVYLSCINFLSIYHAFFYFSKLLSYLEKLHSLIFISSLFPYNVLYSYFNSYFFIHVLARISIICNPTSNQIISCSIYFLPINFIFFKSIFLHIFIFCETAYSLEWLLIILLLLCH